MIFATICGKDQLPCSTSVFRSPAPLASTFYTNELNGGQSQAEIAEKTYLNLAFPCHALGLYILRLPRIIMTSSRLISFDHSEQNIAVLNTKYWTLKIFIMPSKYYRYRSPGGHTSKFFDWTLSKDYDPLNAWERAMVLYWTANKIDPDTIFDLMMLKKFRVSGQDIRKSISVWKHTMYHGSRLYKKRTDIWQLNHVGRVLHRIFPLRNKVEEIAFVGEKEYQILRHVRYRYLNVRNRLIVI